MDDLLRPDDRYIGICAKCGREGLKKRMNTLSIREAGNYASPRALCHICPRCLPQLLDELEVAMPG